MVENARDSEPEEGGGKVVDWVAERISKGEACEARGQVVYRPVKKCTKGEMGEVVRERVDGLIEIASKR